MRVVVAISAMMLVADFAASTIVHVPGGAPTIQEGLDIAASGDTVLVAPDTYTGLLNRDLDFTGKSVVLSSSAGAAATIIDCEGLGRGFRFHSGEDSTCVVQGFSVVDGSADYGGGVIVEGSSGPRFEECVFSDCHAGSGGAVYGSSRFVDVLFRDCHFVDNSAVGRGGALDCAYGRLALTDCVFIGNDAANSGGAVSCAVEAFWSSATIIGCTFESNSSDSHGGGVFTDSYIEADAGVHTDRDFARGRETLLLQDCVFSENVSATRGGAVFAAGSYGEYVDIVNCTFIQNTAPHGGAIEDWAGFSSLTGCVFSKNSSETGGAAYIGSWGPWVFEDCTFSFNEAASGAAFVWGESGSRVLRNMIIAFSSGGEAVVCSGAPPTLTHSVVFGNTHGDSLSCQMVDNLFEDPLFCDVSTHDLTLCANSPCLPDSNHWGELVGPLGEGCEDCDSAVQRTSWGSIKAMFR